MKKNGFTLIELLAVIIILGILMIIAIPSVTRYISDSRKNAYVDTAKEIISGARNLVNEGKLEMYDTNTTYYIPSNCIKTENASKSPYGDFIKDKTYVVVTYDGKGYSYYWVSLDDAGEGVPELKNIDELDIDDIKSDLTRDDIKDNVGVGNRDKVTIFNETCTGKIDKDAYTPPVCRRATTLHTETCTRTDSKGCRFANLFPNGGEIKYGNTTTTDGVLKTGDAFDCDVNGDGIYDSETERFYYVNSYYNTKTNNFDDMIAVLIYYTNISGGTTPTLNDHYSYCSGNSYVPNVAVNQLPTKSQWKNKKLISPGERVVRKTGGGLPQNVSLENATINYGDHAARLITYQEVNGACKDQYTQSCVMTGNLRKLYYLHERSEFSSSSGSPYWLETNDEDQRFYNVQGDDLYINSFHCADTRFFGIRPAIDVYKSDMEY